ncbi:arylsulfatase [Coraliomargarita algicola]|uniref:Arylsulfatase n=1 Tax=Coraliomargarita algicola TaxID=3092156 RepID=A0ABZ0RLF8_9BACT|nr:arylsulfatase [Coraliomargarita sp. J2-16]WPJ96256.1 arylsulfatase [Coraliomargarita sp. J2-16]
MKISIAMTVKACALLALTSLVSIAATQPNIVFIFADDMGYGDVQVLNPERGKIPTPHIDALARDGMIFTDAHTSSSVCTPSRYSLMTGRYNWRTTRQAGVLGGFGNPLIPTGRMTVASLLKAQGYRTAMIGKWHLGMNLPKGQGMNNIDWSGTITGGPFDLGFDYYFGISASLDMPPYIYIENDKFVGECTTTKAFFRKGPAHEDFEAVNVLDDLAEKAVEFIEKQEASTPFFTYIALPSPHTPIVPTPEWKGKSELGAYGDFQMQTDAFVGQIVAAVDAGGFSQNTIIIVSSDNGCSKAAGIPALEAKGHFPSAQFRGSKSDLWDGGHRVPFIVRWPAIVEAGSQSDELICLTDFMATCAELSGGELPADAGEDSVSFLPALKGDSIESTRAGIVHHSISGHFAYRMGKWKLLLSKGSAGWTSPTEKQMPKESPNAQLYDLGADPGETTNLYESHPEVAARLLAQLESDVARGRSTEGPAAKNDTNRINLWKITK